MSRASFERAPIDYADPRILQPRLSATDDDQRLAELRNGIRICRVLVTGWCSLEQLGDELRLHPRSVRRYVYALQAVGLDIVERRPKGSATTFYRLEARSWHGLPYLPKD